MAKAKMVAKPGAAPSLLPAPPAVLGADRTEMDAASAAYAAALSSAFTAVARRIAAFKPAEMPPLDSGREALLAAVLSVHNKRITMLNKLEDQCEVRIDAFRGAAPDKLTGFRLTRSMIERIKLLHERFTATIKAALSTDHATIDRLYPPPSGLDDSALLVDDDPPAHAGADDDSE